MNERKTSDQGIEIGDVVVRLRGQCVLLVDATDGSIIILEPEEAEQLRQWLAEVL